LTPDGLSSEPTTSTRPAAVVVRPASYGDSDVAALVLDVQAVYVALYGGEDETPMTPDDFLAPEGTFVVAEVDGAAVGCGAFRRHDGLDVAEIKRMYVRPAARGRGVGRAVLEDLERRAAAAGYRRVVLETGARQPEAIALYASAGYREIEPYGFYRCSPLSRCFGKDLPG
jgi:GNAT superfamily N-acetyltransferase